MLKAADFELTSNELAAINKYIRARAKSYAAAGEGAASSASITFVFTSALGRSVTVRFDDELIAFEVESCGQ